MKLPKSFRVWRRKRRYRKDKILTVLADLDQDAKKAALDALKRDYELDHQQLLKG